MILRNAILHEWKTTLSRPAAIASFLLLACLMAYAAWNGQSERHARTEAIAAHETEVAAATATWLQQLKTLEAEGPGPGVPAWSGSAMDVPLASALPPAPLSDFAIGQSDLLPYLGALSLWDPDMRLFSRYEIDDPVSLGLGAFDLSKAVVLVLPLVLIVLCFDVLSADRDAGRLSLVLAQGARLRQVVWLRLSIRAATLFVCVGLLACTAVVIPTPGVSLAERLPYFGVWLLTALLYGAFWVALLAWVVSANRSSTVNLTGLLLAWAGLTCLLPATVSSVAEAAYPIPSRLALLAEAREVEIETELTESDATARYLLDHPDMVIDESSQMPAYVRTAFLATKAVDEATRPALLAFEEAAGKRERTLDLMRYLSPAIAVYGVLVDTAGSSARTHRHYMASARKLKASFAEQAGGFIVAGLRLPLKDAATLPRLDLKPETAVVVLGRAAGTIVFLTLVTAVLLLVAHRALRLVELSPAK